MSPEVAKIEALSYYAKKFERLRVGGVACA
jgi:hypothetical protein